MHLALLGKQAPLVKGRAFVARTPEVEQDVPWADVIARHFSLTADKRDVADAANVDHGDLLAFFGKTGLMKQRDQRRALAAIGHVHSAEIADHRNTGERSEHMRIADL